MRPLKKMAQTARIEKREWTNAIYDFIFAYRNTPHSTTKVSPAELMFNRKPNYTIPNATLEVEDNIVKIAEENDEVKKQQNKTYIDSKRHASERMIRPGDRVLVRQTKRNKLTPNYSPNILVVVERKGSMVTAEYEHNKSTITRNISYFKKLPSKSSPAKSSSEERGAEHSVPIQKHYPKRERKKRTFYEH